ncbi:MAG: sigma 54-interacting transcriptional regulator [Desulfobacteraceae bacterium]|jgi:PAS domain S-box-containing protein
MVDHCEAEKFVEKAETENTECDVVTKLKEMLKESQDRYNRLLENLEEEFLFYRHDAEGNFTYISPSYANILGYSAEEYIGLNSDELWTNNPINIEAARHTMLSCQGVRQPPYEMEIYHKSGALKRFVTIETPIFDDKGNVIAVEGTSRDITEKRKAEEQLERYRLMLEDLVQQRTEELQASKRQLADIIDFFPDPIYVVDRNENIIAWNRAMVAMTHIAKEMVLGKHFKLFIDDFYRSSDPLLIQMVLDGIFDDKSNSNQTVQRQLECSNIRKDKTILFAERRIGTLNNGGDGHVWITAGPILDTNNQIAGAVESIRDVTRIKRAERKVRQNERRLSTLMSNLPGMAYRIHIANNGWQVEFVSEGCQQIFGRQPKFFIGKDVRQFRELICPEDTMRLVEEASSAVNENQPFECEYRILTSDGQTKWVFDKAQVHKNGDGDTLMFEGIMADFTVFKNMEQRLRNENLLLKSTIRDRYKFKNIIGNCPAMQDVFSLIVSAATSNDNVFIYGESGTGKELVARAIHDASERKDNSFVAVNCAAIPETLIESEFFGASKGAFTGANTNKSGYLEAADGGTLFLDEIGEISPSLQVKLLRAIDNGGFSPVGSRRVVRPDLRIIAASNKDLEELMQKGRIRQDFFFRIHVIPIHLPPLRERGDDIILLVNHYLKKFSPSDSIASLDRDELETLKKHRWPGNVRELQNVLRRYIALKNLHFLKLPGQKPIARKEGAVCDDFSDDLPLKEALIQYERKIILRKLDQTRWNKSQAARELGVSRKTLFRKMKACGLM